MKAPFDIAADLDTPVSTYMKLGPLKPRFLLESGFAARFPAPVARWLEERVRSEGDRS